MQRMENAYGRLLEVLALAGCALVLGMMLIICADVFLRNVRILPGTVGLAWANDLTEAGLYLTTMLAAPWLLRRGQHIRLDLVLVMVPDRVAWMMEAACDIAGFIVSVILVRYGLAMTYDSWRSGSITIKNLVFPEWWLLALLPAVFALLAVEFVFRFDRVRRERIRRAEARSAG